MESGAPVWVCRAVAGVLAGLVACSVGQVPPEGELFPEDSLQGMPPQWAVGVSVRLLDSLGGLRAHVEADTASSVPEQGQVVFRYRVHVRFFRAGELIGELFADSARIEDHTGLMAAFGHVVVRSHPEGRRLETTELYWERKRQLFFSPAFVRIVTPSELVEGIGFEATHDLQMYRVFNVRGQRQ